MNQRMIVVLAVVLTLCWGYAARGDSASPRPTTMPAAKAEPKDPHPWIPIELPPSSMLDEHKAFVERAKQGNVDLLFLGNVFISRIPETAGLWLSQKISEARFGMDHNMIQHVLWRISNGELEGIRPRVVVVEMGQENAIVRKGLQFVMFKPDGTRATLNGPSWEDTPEDMVKGFQAVVNVVRTNSPTTRVLILSMVPYGRAGMKLDNDSVWTKERRTNALLGKCANGDTIRFLDITEAFLDSKNVVLEDAFVGRSSTPTPECYQRCISLMRPVIAEMLVEKTTK